MGGFFAGLRGWILGGLAAIAVVLAGLFLLNPPAPPEIATTEPPEVGAVAPDPSPQPQTAPETAPAEPHTSEVEAAPETAAEPAPEVGAPAPETAAVPVPEAEAPAPETAAEPVPEAEAPAPLVPDFDVVRIHPDGDALVAGRAEPGARVAVLVEGALVAEAMADASKGFVAVFALPPSATDRVMLLEATLEDGQQLVSSRSVIIEGVELPEVVAEAAPAPEVADAPPAPEGEAPTPAPTPEGEAPTPAPEGEAPVVADVAPAPEVSPAPPSLPVPNAGGGVEGPVVPTPSGEPGEAQPELPPAPVMTAEAPQASPVPAPEPAPTPAAPRVLLAGPEGITVLQDPGPAPPLSIDTISYDAGGEVTLAGRGRGDETVRVYLDNSPVRSARVGSDGKWRVPLPGVDTGIYTLRIDSIAPDGAVSSRVETPFKREEAEVLEAAEQQAVEAVAEGRMISAVTIQPGNTLWAIAEDRYGEGVQYVRIFGANRDQIRDPDWIYPGQVFTLPDAE